jgi:hypothetical protein
MFAFDSTPADHKSSGSGKKLKHKKKKTTTRGTSSTAPKNNAAHSDELKKVVIVTKDDAASWYESQRAVKKQHRNRMVKWRAVARMCSLPKTTERNMASAVQAAVVGVGGLAVEKISGSSTSGTEEPTPPSRPVPQVTMDGKCLPGTPEIEQNPNFASRWPGWTFDNEQGTAVIRIDGKQISGGFEAQWSPSFATLFTAPMGTNAPTVRSIPVCAEKAGNVAGKVVVVELKEVGSTGPCT